MGLAFSWRAGEDLHSICHSRFVPMVCYRECIVRIMTSEEDPSMESNSPYHSLWPANCLTLRAMTTWCKASSWLKSLIYWVVLLCRSMKARRGSSFSCFMLIKAKVVIFMFDSLQTTYWTERVWLRSWLWNWVTKSWTTLMILFSETGRRLCTTWGHSLCRMPSG